MEVCWKAPTAAVCAASPQQGLGRSAANADPTRDIDVTIPDILSLNPAALALSLGAAYAIFRMKAGMLQVLAATSAAGVLAHLAGVI